MIAYAKKSLGQNFLINQGVVQKIVDSLHITSGDTVYEIGPGKGALTRGLLAANPKSLHCIEMDQRMLLILEETFVREITSGLLTLHHQDILKWQPPNTPFKLIGNIPFYITGAILKHILDQDSHPETMTLLMQKEVAERITRKNGKNSILGTAVNIYCTPKIIATVQPGSFNPPPNVTSQVISFTQFTQPFSSSTERTSFFNFLKQLFGQKRKTIRANLRPVYGEEVVASALQTLGHPKDTRAEDLTPAHIVFFFSKLNPHTIR